MKSLVRTLVSPFRVQFAQRRNQTLNISFRNLKMHSFQFVYAKPEKQKFVVFGNAYGAPFGKIVFIL